jgi:type I restriction enzyme M protein
LKDATRVAIKSQIRHSYKKPTIGYFMARKSAVSIPAKSDPVQTLLKMPEHNLTRLPLIQKLIQAGWSDGQIQWQPEWKVPKSPSEAAKRESGQSYSGFPVDIVIFDEAKNKGNWQNILAIIETKAPDKKSGLSQLETYMCLEPRALIGFWTNGKEGVSLQRLPNGRFLQKNNARIPYPDDDFFIASDKKMTWFDLIVPDVKELRGCFQRLLEYVVANDTKSTRRDDQLNQLCNLLLIKLESDKRAKIAPKSPLIFQVHENEEKTALKIKEFFEQIKRTHSDLYNSAKDQEIVLDDSTIHKACFELSLFRLVDSDIDIISSAFQIFRTASLKSDDGQYFTPYPVIRSAVKLMEIKYDDTILDPACGTGGFLVEAFRQFNEEHPDIEAGDAKAWAQKHLYGVDKDSINVKLTKAEMMIIGDGSTHTFIGDSIRKAKWSKTFPHLESYLKPASFTCILTNPPFGKNLKINPNEAKENSLSICRSPEKTATGIEFSATKFCERELGIVFIERCHELLVKGGRLGIILPETYFFSSSYIWLQHWLESRFILRGMVNIPMEAFQGFCRAKTNFYILEKK